ncbi:MULTISPECIES: OmpW family outer membrane protein [Stutzerimonas stutzeri subgroup]|uniref:Outer membrane beta-barrel protein n=1 Tax=Stutzerimonas kunmingensis TaxID=1211807 RepID=A0A9X1SSA6_9GAMM|nr:MULTISPECIES: OmpW family outer membrane protein [Stutzerimonas stutzeri group]KJS78310.1 MAG: membrane protein [[Pseudomonas] sp. BICA1-14]MCD1607226.1 outer membrane beta-barrel protein [Stutzerimonas kunmingensis]MCQ2033866.1 outer membrane beta-barrel protein [Stutzerimonas kunmingensis]PNG02329.1 outer membrane protein OmpW [Stutzerimonas kunmingensis]
MRKTLFTASALALALAAPFAQAFEAGDIIVRAGAITVDPHEDSSDVKVGGAAQGGTGATLNSDTQLGLNFAYMVTDKVGVELLAATPFSHDVGTKGLGGLKLGELKHLPPTLSVIYYPMEKTSAFQPYVGAGINYTWFFDDKLTSEAENSALQLRGLDMKDSWGLAAQVGMDYMLTDNLMLNAQVRYIDIDTTGTTYSEAADAKIKVDVDVDPFVYMVGLGYKF